MSYIEVKRKVSILNGQLSIVALKGLTVATVLLYSSYAAAQTWIDELPNQVRECILWSGDHEEGNMDDWEYKNFQWAGGGIFNTGDSDVEAVASTDVAHSGQYSSRATITNAFQSQNGKRAVRLMRWTDRAWDDGGEHFPKTAYYSTWMYFPQKYNPNKSAPWDPGDGGWWNIFQFKSRDGNDVSQPMWTLNVAQNEQTRNNYVYLYSKYNSPASREQQQPLTLPVRQWVHFEALYDASKTDGRITIWQDGNQILDADGSVTVHPTGDEVVTWGIGNYTDHIAGGAVGGTATIYFDDAIVSKVRVLSSNQGCRPGNPRSTFNINPQSVDEAVGIAQIRVTLDPSSTERTRVSFATNPASAKQGEDFYGTYQVLDFEPGETSVEVPVTVVDDGETEPDEAFSVRLFAAENADMANGSAAVTIRDNDENTVTVSVSDARVTEGETGRIVVQLSRALTTTSTVSIATLAGDATQGEDFYGLYEVLAFNPGETRKSIQVVTVDDTVTEQSESFTQRLFAAEGVVIANGIGRTTITDND